MKEQDAKESLSIEMETNQAGNDLADEPWDHRCYTTDFANMIQLFTLLTSNMEFSQPFRVVVDYDPKQLRTSVKTYLPKKLHESRIREAEERRLALRSLPRCSGSSLGNEEHIDGHEH